MPKISCPKCGAFLQIDDDMLGTAIACGGCSNEFVAQAEKPRYDYEHDEWDDHDADYDEEPLRSRSGARRNRFGDDDEEYDDNDLDDRRTRRQYRRQPNQQNGYAVASLVLGIIALMCAFMAFFTCGMSSFLAIPCSVTGIILGIVGMKPGSKGLAIGGIATSAVGIAITVAVIAAVGIFVAQVQKAMPPPPPPGKFNPPGQKQPGFNPPVQAQPGKLGGPNKGFQPKGPDLTQIPKQK